MVQSAVWAHVPLHVPPPPPPTNNASYQCQSTIWAQKTSVGALQTGAELNGAKKISCAKTGGAAKSRKKHPRNYPPWCALIKLKSTYCVAIMIPNKRSVSLASQQLFFKSCPRYHFRGAVKKWHFSANPNITAKLCALPPFTAPDDVHWLNNYAGFKS